MKQSFSFLLKRFLVILVFISINELKAQAILEKLISVQFTNERLENVLEIISNKGNFYFSY